MNISIKQPAKVFKSRHFRSLFLVIWGILTLLALAAAILFFSQRVRVYRQQAEDQVNRLSLAVQAAVQAAKSNGIFLGSMNSVNHVLNLESPSWIDYLEMINDIAPYHNQSNYEAISIFMEKQQQVYVAGVGMYSYSAYFDQELLALLHQREPEELWLGPRGYSLYYGDNYPSSVVSYVRKAPLFNPHSYGYVVLNVPVRYLQEVIAKEDTNPAIFTVLHCDRQPIYVSASLNLPRLDANSLAQLAAPYLRGSPGMAQGVVSQSPFMEATCYIKPAVLWSELRQMLPGALVSYLLLVLLAFGCALAYSSWTLGSVDRIIQRAQGVLRKPAPEISPKNEFEVLDELVEGLNSRILDAQQTVAQNLPLVQEHLVAELMCNYVDMGSRLQDYARHGIHFLHPYFSVVILSLSHLNQIYGYSVKEQLKLVVRQKALDSFATMGVVYAAYTEDETISFLLNTDFYEGLEPRISQLCKEVSDALAQLGTPEVLFAAALCDSASPIPYLAWSQARKTLVFSGSDGQEIPFSYPTANTLSWIDPGLVARLTRCVLDRNEPAIAKQLRFFHDTYLSPNTELADAQRLTTLYLLSVAAKLLEVEVTISDTLLCGTIRKIADADAIDECEALLVGFLTTLFKNTQSMPNESQGYIVKAVEFIHNHYAEDITIPQIADCVSVHAIYLNKLFKLSTGKTVSEYLNSYRIGVSKKMLLEGRDTVAGISERVGYRDTRSYIRFFKKYEGTTPNEFRKENGTTS